MDLSTESKTTPKTAEELQRMFDIFSSANPFPESPAGLYDAVRHIMAIPGKRLRPILLMAAAEMFGAEAEEAAPAALAVEWYHNSTLVHDDIMDAADLRRGMPTVHNVYGINTAINTGDVMIIRTYEMLAKLKGAGAVHVMNTFTKAATEVIEGQTMDLDFETRTDVTVEEYLKMIELKTSVLIAAAIRMGAQIGGASARNAEAMYQFGLNLGISFQIKDDWLDSFGEGEKTGKKVGGDILRKKRTLLYLMARAKANDKQRAELTRLETEPDADAKIRGTLAIWDTLGIRNLAEARIAEFYEEALRNLDSVMVDDERKNVLRDLARRIFERDF
jgi:geranylgeranyl diphosphate synthase type II